MSIQITASDVEKALAYGGQLRQKALSARATGEYVINTVAQQVESGAAAFGYGVLQGGYGPIKVGPVALDLGMAAGLHALGFLGVFGKFSGHGHNFAQGLLDGYLSRMGEGVGATMRAQGKLPAVKTAGSTLFAGTNSRRGDFGHRTNVGAAIRPKKLTEAEIASMAQQVR